MSASQKFNRIYVGLMLMAVFFGMVYVMTAHLDFIRNAIRYEATTLTNISTAIFRAECVFVPFMFVLPRNNYIPKIVLLKITMGVVCVTCLAGVMWFFQYLNFYTVREMFDSLNMYIYQSNTQYYIGFNRFMWANQGASGVILSFVLSVMYLLVTTLLHKGRITVAAIFSLIAALRLIAPMCVATGEYQWTISQLEWLDKNKFWIISEMFFIAGMWVAARSDRYWVDYIWGEFDEHMQARENEEE